MSGIATKALIIVVIVLSLTGCAVHLTSLDPQISQSPAVENLKKHAQRAKTEPYAALVQSTVNSDVLNKRFNVEIYTRGDSLALYSGGFLGKGGFKALNHGDSIAVALLTDKEYYRGASARLVRPDISRYDYVRRALFRILQGDYLLIDASSETDSKLWRCRVSVSGEKIRRLEYFSESDSVTIDLKLRSHRAEFPYAQIDEIRVASNKTGSKIKLVFIESKYTEVPDLKFSMREFEGWRRLEYLELE